MPYITCFEPEGSSSGNCCVYRHGIVCCTWISVSSLVGEGPLILMHVLYNTLYHTCILNRLPEDEPWVSKHVENIN